MKKRSILNSIAVKTPCSQDWDQMYGNDEVRFCEHCVKHVHDLSAMTRKTAEKFVAEANGSICVRYVRRPDGKMQTAGEKLYQISSRASRLAAGVFSASLTFASSAYAQSEPVSTKPDSEVVVTLGEITPRPNIGSGGSISGTITDTYSAVIPRANVTLKNSKTGAIEKTLTNEDGHYLFSSVENGNYDLVFSARGFSESKIENINIKDATDAKYDTVLNVYAITIMGDMVMAVRYENQLIRAVEDGDTKRIKELIARGVNVNEKDNYGGITALHLAVRKADVETVTMLLNLGAKVNVRDDRGRTAIMQIGEDHETEETDDVTAARIGTKIFDLLISHGAKVNLRDSVGFTALMYAAGSENPVLLKLLINHNAKINIQAKNGRTALMEAANEDELENVRILLQAGAEVNLKDSDGETALSLTSDIDIEELLLTYGAPSQEPEDN